MRKLGIKTLLLAITLLNSSTTFIRPEFKINTVVIDPGHGGRDPGTHGAFMNEKDVTLKISMKVGNYIEKNFPGVKVIYTRKEDKYLPLDERAIMAIKNKADLFLCIHANASPHPTTYGTETYVMGMHKTESNLEVATRENSVILLDENHEERYQGFDPKSPESYILFSLAQNAYLESSLVFADKIETQFRSKTGRYSHGVKQAGFWVLWRTAMPSVLVEVGFLTNKKEEKYLSEEAGQDQIAAGIYKAFKDYKTQIESVN